MSKSYSDARKELEKIAVQRRNFILNSDSVKADFYNAQNSFDSRHRPSSQQSVLLSPRTKFADNSRESTPMSASLPPTNIYFRNENDRAPSSSSMSPSLASFKRELEKSMPPYSSPAGVSQHFLSTLSPIPGLGTASSVISAFRQLQTRSRKIEQERSAAMKERDDLRKQVEEHSQNLEMWRRQSEAQTSERFRSMKAASDELLLNRRDLELKMISLQEAFSSSQQSNSADRSALLSLETERADIRAITHTVRSNVKTLRGELSLASNRCNRISGQIGSGPPSAQQHESQLSASIQSITREIDSAERSKVLVSMRCGALQHYMELILKINGDLTKRIGESEGIHGQISFEEDEDSVADLDEIDEDDDMQAEAMEPGAAALPPKKSKARPLSAPPRPRGTNADFSSRSDSMKVLRGNEGTGGGTGTGGVRFSMDSAYRALSADPNKRRANTARYRSSSSSGTVQKGPVPSAPSGRRVEAVRCKGTSALSTSSSRARATAWMSNGGDPMKSISRSKSPSSHPSRTTSTTGSLSGTSEQSGLLNVEDRDTLFGHAVSAAALTRGGFIPGGNTEGKEFNVYANGSKLARATAHYNAALASRSAPIQTSQSTIAPTNIKNLPGMSRSLSLLLLTLPLLLMSYRMSGTHRSASHTRASSLHATTSRNLLDDQSASTDDSKFSFEKLPNPLKANSQKTALKLVALSRKVQNLLTALSQEQVVKVTGLTIEKINKIIVKSEKIEQKLLEVNLRLVHSIALQHQGMGLELEDLVYEGVRGLKKALSKFDPEKGFAFSTYAYPWIREYIRAALASSLPIALPRHVYRLLMKVRSLQQQMLATGRVPSDEETAEEMGITIERFEVVRRAMALAARSNDATPALSLAGSSDGRIQFDESTWERVVEAQREGSVLEHVVSNQAQPHAHNERAQSEIRGAVLRALNTLPEDESRAIHERLGLGSFATTDQGTGRGTGVLRFSEMDATSGADKETSKALYQKGVRRLRRRVSDPKYPEMKALERIFNELEYSSGNVLQDV